MTEPPAASLATEAARAVRQGACSRRSEWGARVAAEIYPSKRG
jgi:hypothetical protein